MLSGRSAPTLTNLSGRWPRFAYETRLEIAVFDLTIPPIDFLRLKVSIQSSLAIFCTFIVGVEYSQKIEENTSCEYSEAQYYPVTRRLAYSRAGMSDSQLGDCHLPLTILRRGLTFILVVAHVNGTGQQMQVNQRIFHITIAY